MSGRSGTGLVAKKADLLPGEPTEEPQVAVFYIDRWLANPKDKAMLIEMYKSVCGFVNSAWGAALPPLGFALAVTGVLVVGIEIAIYVHSGPKNIMEDLEEELAKANDREFGRRFLEPDKATKYRTPDTLDRFAGDAEAILG